MKGTFVLTLATVLFGALATTASAGPNVWVQSSGMTSGMTSSKGVSGESQRVHVQIYNDDDAVVKKTIKVTTKNGIKITKTTEERTQDGHTETTTQTKTEKVKGSKCCGLTKLRRLKKWLNNLENRIMHQKKVQGGDCAEQCRHQEDDHGNRVVDGDHAAPGPQEHADECAATEQAKKEHAAQEEFKKMKQKMAQHEQNMRNQIHRIQNSIQENIQNTMTAFDREILNTFRML
jgi:hypothetical protein